MRMAEDSSVPAAELRTRPGPSFLFIGAAKAGSSWFFEVLREHPAVFVPPNRGTYFFSKLYDMQRDWYEGFFPALRDGHVCGEVCHDYLLSPETLRRIKEYRPDMRLICCLRNPYERAISASRFYARNGMGAANLCEQGEKHPDVIYQGYYATQLRVVRSLFPADQLLIFFFEELSSNPRAVARRLYSFVGVDPGFVPPSLHRRVNSNARPRSRLLARWIHHVHVHSWGRSRIASNVVGWIKRFRPLRRLVTASLYRPWPAPDDWRNHFSEFPERVVSRYEDEITQLESMLERDLWSWRAAAVDATHSLAAPMDTVARSAP